MIEHHPHPDILKQFVDASLPVSISVIVSAHIEMCSKCQQSVAHLTDIAGLKAFDMLEDDILHMHDIDDEQHVFSDFFDSRSFKNIQSNVMASMTCEPVMASPVNSQAIEVAGKQFILPRALNSLVLKEWRGFGKISRARLQLDDGKRRTSLLCIDKEGFIPFHSHCGFEITLLLQGSFDDEMGHYRVGDFIWLNEEQTHAPITSEGCVCLTVSDNALRFRQGVSQLINPLGKLIY